MNKKASNPGPPLPPETRDHDDPDPHKPTVPKSAIVTIKNWIRAPDGELYLNFFCGNWGITTDESMSDFLEGNFRSPGKWQLVAKNYDGSLILAIFPGCGVAGYMAAAQAPERGTSKVYVFPG